MSLIIGNNSANTLLGTSGSDLILAGNGNDVVSAGNGTDVVEGGNGNDNLDGGAGCDLLDGGNGDDNLSGGDGTDVLLGGNGNDVLDGGAGSDLVLAGSGNDTVIHLATANAGSGNVYDGGSGRDTLRLVVDNATFNSAAFQADLAHVQTMIAGRGSASGVFDSLDIVITSFERIEVVVEGPANQAPTGIVLSNAAVAENSATGTVVGALSAVDPDAGDTATFTLLDDAGGRFTISGGNLVVAGALDHEVGASHQVTVRVTDAGGLTRDEQFTIVVGDVNEVPTDIALSNDTVTENSPAGTVLGALSAFDPDAGDSATFTLLDDAGGRFAINGDQLVVAGALDFETAASHQITVRVTDSGGLVRDEQFTIAVANVAEPIVGTPGPDNLVGTPEDDTIQALGGNDVLTGGGGNDTLEGGGGIDIAVFSGSRAAYTLGQGTVTGPDGADTTTGIELLRFDDAFVLGFGQTPIDLSSFGGLTPGVPLFGRGVTDLLTIGSNANGRLIDLGGGSDTLTIGLGGGSPVSVNLNVANVETINAFSGSLTINMASTLNGTTVDLGTFGDALNLNNGNNVVTTIGVDVVNAGMGNDTLTFIGDGTTVGQAINLGGGTNVVNLAGEFSDFTLALSGTNLTVLGQTIGAAAGNENVTLTNVQGGTTFDLGAGTDSLTLFNDGQFVNVVTVQNVEAVTAVGFDSDQITIAGNAGGITTVTAGGGADFITASGDTDHFRFVMTGDSSYDVPFGGQRDRVTGFDVAEDKFVFDGIAGATSLTWELIEFGGIDIARVDLDGNAAGEDGWDMAIELDGLIGTLTNDNFLLL